MSTRLSTIDVLDWHKGLNMRRSELTLASDESPWLGNIEVDPRGGFETRSGWDAWNPANIVPDPVADWRPRNAEAANYADGSLGVFISNNGKVHACGDDKVFYAVAPVATATPHLADFAQWGDVVYMALGRAQQARKLTGEPGVANQTAAALVSPGVGTWNDDYTTPVGGKMPACELVEAHGGYLFVANTVENGNPFSHRVRWSHPDQPEDWAEADFIDIEQGGSRITAIRSFEDHLVIFKDDAAYALFGYDRDSWQLVKMSRSVGAPGPHSVTRSNDSLYIYSAASGDGIFRYQGREPVRISDPITLLLEDVQEHDDVWLGWINHRLWCSIPVEPGIDGTPDSHGGCLLFDPEYESWVRHTPAAGTIAAIVEYSDSGLGAPLVVTCGCTGFAGLYSVTGNRFRAGDILTPGGSVMGFRPSYRTAWFFANTPDRQKSWLRCKLISRTPTVSTRLAVRVFHDFNSAIAERQLSATLTPGSYAVWGVGVWGVGVWTSGSVFGDQLARPAAAGVTLGALGWARAIQLEIRPVDHTLALPFTIDAVSLKVNHRRETT